MENLNIFSLKNQEEVKEKEKEFINDIDVFVDQFKDCFKGVVRSEHTQRHETLFKRYGIQTLVIDEPFVNWLSRLLKHSEKTTTDIEFQGAYSTLYIEVQSGSGRYYGKRKCWIKIPSIDYNSIKLLRANKYD